MMNSRQNKIILFVVAALFFFLNTLTLKDGHMLGGDFAQYVQHSLNILEHKPYDYGLNLDAWVLCAPGLPLLLAPVIKVFGINLVIMKFLNVLSWLLFGWMLYKILKDKLDEELAVLAVSAILLSHFFFIFKQNILTDMPFAFFVTAAIYSFEKYWRADLPARRKELIWFIVIALTAFLFRYAGAVLSASAVLYAWFIKKDRRPVLPVLSGAAAGILAQFLIGASAQGHFAELPAMTDDWLTLSYLNISYILFCFMYFYFPGRTPAELGLQAMIVPALDLFSLVIVFGLGWMFIRRCRSREISFSEFFFFIYLAGLIIWPLADGPRYLFPIVGLGWIVLYRASSRFAVWGKSALKILAVLILLVNIAGIAADIKFNDDELLEPQLQEVFQWVRDNAGGDEAVMFRYARELGLYTGKPSLTLWFRGTDRRHFSTRAKYFDVRYVINDKKRDEFQLEEGSEGGVILKKIWENEKYRIFEVKKEAH